MFHGAKIVNKDELRITKKGGNKVVNSKKNRTFARQFNSVNYFFNV